MPEPNVVVVGSSNTDLVLTVPSLPAPGETVLGGALQTIAGGKGANQAVAAARLGARVTLLARVGDDAYGLSALAGLRAESVETRYIRTTPGIASGVAMIAVDEGTAQNVIYVAPGANAALSADDIERARSAFADADILVVSLEIPETAVLAAVRLAAHVGKPVVLNPAPARPLPPELLRCLTVLTPNEAECVQLGGADALLAAGVQAVVTTLGEHGADLRTPGSSTRIAGHTVQAVDTVAAGDCFTAALAVALAKGDSLPEAVPFANAAAALKVTRPGAQPGLPTRDEVELFLRQRA